MDALLSDFRAFASLPEPQRDWAELSGLVADSVAALRGLVPGGPLHASTACPRG